MVRVGMIGAGKLGLPVALAINSFGFDVCVTDINPSVERYLIDRKIPYKEELADELLKIHTIQWCDTVSDIIRNSDVIFMPVQTPHDKKYEGITRLPAERKDFDYTYLINAVQGFTDALALSSDPSPKTLVIISTVLPGTIRREILPIIEKDKRIVLVYNPFFIAMGTVIYDFLHPEFVLLGLEDEGSIPGHLLQIYSKIHRNIGELLQVMSIESAELTKCCYNTFITSKICMVNTIGEICHKIPGANVDDITNALKQATDRLISPKYLTAGLGDGGGCTTGDTKISLLNGTEIPIKDLVGQKFWVYSYDHYTNSIVPGRAVNCRKTRKNQKILKITLDNDQEIKCTYDHKFLLRNGRYTEAQYLQVDQSLMPLYRSYNTDGYEKIKHPVGGQKQLTHKMVHTWKYGYDVSYNINTHHKDRNIINNSPNNIMSLTRQRHNKYHCNLLENRLKTSERNKINNPMFIEEYRNKMKLGNHITQSRLVSAGKHHFVTNNPGKKALIEGNHNFQINHPMKNEKSKQSMIINLSEFFAKRAGFSSFEDSTDKILELKNKGYTVKQIMKELGCSRRMVYTRLYQNNLVDKKVANHKIKKIEYGGQHDVYNFEVERYHNYALTSGVFIANCHPRDNIAMSWLAKKLNLSYDWFENLMISREKQAEFIAALINEHFNTGDEIIILGYEFKPETNLTTGSHALLVYNILKERYKDITILQSKGSEDFRFTGLQNGKQIFFIGCKQQKFVDFKFPVGSVVIDPFRYIPDQPGCKVIRIGE